MSRFIVLILILLLQVKSFTQSIYYDTWKLKDNLSGKIFNFKVAHILTNYFFIDTTGLNSNIIKGKIDASLKLNPFLNDYSIQVGQQFGPEMLKLSNITETFGGLDVTHIADGFAKFLVKRTKEELAIAFFDKFKEAIEDNNFKDIKTVFPETYKTIEALEDEVYQFDAYMQTFRESFEKDLRDLTSNLPSITKNHQIFFSKHPNLRALLQSGCYLAEALRNNEHPGEILNNYPIEYLDNLNKNWKGAIQTLQLISSSFRDTSQSNSAPYWVSSSQIKELASDEITFRIFLGLMYEKSKHFENNSPVEFKNETLTNILDPIGQHFVDYYPSYKSYFIQLGTRLDNITNLFNQIRKTISDSLKLDQFYNLANVSIDFLKSTGDLGKLIPWKNLGAFRTDSAFFKNIKDSLASYFNVASSSAHIAWDIKRRSYASAIVNLTTIYKSVLPDNNESNQGKDILKYGTFMATIVQAKNPDQVEETIEAFALPSGSSRIKRGSKFNVSLNTYVGLFIGKENISGLNNDSGLNNFGVAAPIGVAFSWGHFLGNGSFSFFLSFVDLGAVASFRFVDDTTNQVPTIKLKDLFSPGVFISYGIPSWPVSLNFGAQMGPNLRRVSSATNDYSNKIYWRYSFSICVDIPLLNFYTKPGD